MSMRASFSRQAASARIESSPSGIACASRFSRSKPERRRGLYGLPPRSNSSRYLA